MAEVDGAVSAARSAPSRRTREGRRWPWSDRRRDESLRQRRCEIALFIFARFHALPGREGELESALRDNLAPTRAEPGCRSIRLFRSIRDDRLFYIHSRFEDEAAFERHAALPHTVRMIGRVEPLLDHPFAATRAEQID